MFLEYPNNFNPNKSNNNNTNKNNSTRNSPPNPLPRLLIPNKLSPLTPHSGNPTPSGPTSKTKLPKLPPLRRNVVVVDANVRQACVPVLLTVVGVVKDVNVRLVFTKRAAIGQ